MGGGGIVSTCGGASAHTSSTRHARGRPRSGRRGRCCAGRGGKRSPLRARSRTSMASAAVDHLVLHAPGGDGRRRRRGRVGRARRPPSRRPPRRRWRRTGSAGPGAAGGVARAAPTRALGQRLDVVRGDVQQRDVSVGGQAMRQRRPPSPPTCPPRSRRARASQVRPFALNHRSTVAATRPAGTVSAPRRTNSPSSTSWSSTRRTRRHSSVASEPM